MNNQYIVWIGGSIDYEGSSSLEANQVFKFWVNQGYDDVILEVIKPGTLKTSIKDYILGGLFMAAIGALLAAIYLYRIGGF
jgi:hypothetical protein